MPRPLPVDYLQEGESPIHETGRHGLSVMDEILVTTILIAAPITGLLVWSLGYFPPAFLPIALPGSILLFLLWAIFLITRYWRVTTSIYVVTPERVYKAYGRIRFFLEQTTYDKLTDLHVKQSLFGRIWNFGTVRLETAGTGIALQGVRDPFAYKQTIEDARTQFIKTLVGESKPRRATSKATTAGHAITPAAPVQHWNGSPTLASFVGNLLASLFMVLPMIGFFIGGLFVEPALMLVALGLGLLFAAMLAAMFIRYKFTKYFVEERGVVVTSGWLTRRRVETTYDKVTDVTTYQGLLGRMMGFGNITINTAGSTTAPVVFQGLQDPERVKELIDDARRARESA